MGSPVEYPDHEHGTTVRGWIIDSQESQLTNRLMFLVSDSPGDDPEVDGHWVPSSECQRILMQYPGGHERGA